MFSARGMIAKEKSNQQHQSQQLAIGSEDPSPPPSPDPSSSSSSSSNQLIDASSTNQNATATLPPTKQGSYLSQLLEENPIFSGGLGLMVFGGAIAFLRKGTSLAASSAQRRLLISLEIPSKDRAHPWFLHWMGAQAKAQMMREKGLLGAKPRKESLMEFLGLDSKQSSWSPSGDIGKKGKGKGKGKGGEIALAEVGGASHQDPLTISSSGESVSPVRIYSHDLSVETSYVPHSSASTPGAGASERGNARFSLVPGPGTHWFRYKGVWMRLQRERDGKMVDLSTGAPWETVTLTTLFNYAYLFPQLLSEARQLALASTEGKTVIYTSWGPEWRPFGQPRRTRELGSVILGKGKKERIVGDVKRFLERGSWYAERGIPYRRGYLLHGAPGSGKSSFITALAGSLDFNICLLNLSERGLTDDKLNHLLSNVPERSILLLEDVDAAFLGRQQAAEDGYQASVTFSGLLNALDGVASGESRIIFMTTNHVERLDSALIRPGRVDLIEELGDAETSQVKELMMRFYRDTVRDKKIRELEQGGVPRGFCEQSVDDMKDNKATVQGSSELQEGGVAEIEEQAEKEIQTLSERLSEMVEREAIRRRACLGLDPSGKRRLSSSTTTEPDAASSSTVQERNEALQGVRSLRPQAAASGGVSMAELQGLFIRFPDDPEGAIQAFEVECEMRRKA
ncbi:hypothetical protein IE53DRAFT_385035 [Violaceomyces palustris]|uniref:Uncharacterized protein n=1 Tax=Violaceomyces palustris TaxID=1673888 RepID=A0ACD0P3K8_9BASI|nr:hypothetical protein IE53DRAFT_385035 [Violaceomyces palustris]